MNDNAISFAEVSDVEKRLGFELEEAQAEALSLFLEDFTATIQAEFRNLNKDINQVQESLLKRVTAQRGRSWVLYTDLGVAGVSQTVGDVSISVSSSQAINPSRLYLTKDERFTLGLKKISAYTITLGRE